ncbi:TorF family putative porin [Sphingomonas sp. TX0543]|uniref:TorF family putative porin n=1 Tax=unclassified Sphingomonas TaxID=196159 RepID=UPI0010F8E496|nr:TorF family putative porin [Sphingomonas sp. 3P27F8]
MKTIFLVSAIALGFAASPAVAQEAAPPKEITVTGSVAVVSDYRLRGVSQTDKRAAIQGGFTVAHKSGFYLGTWASNLAGWGTFGGSNMELDLIGGYKAAIGSGVSVDAGLTYYVYPGGAKKTAFAEPYVKLSGTAGPASVLVGVAYAPKQQALGKWYNDAASYATGIPDHPGAKNDNLYIWTDLSAAIPTTPLTAKAHLGHSNGNNGLGPNGTSAAPTGHYWDWMVGADFAIKGTPLTLSAAWIDTSITRRKAAYLQPNFASTRDGSSIAGSSALFSVTAAF